MATKAGATIAPIVPSYEDFEPLCKWERKEESDILIVDLQDFRKDQLKAQIDNQEILTIVGERPVDKTKWSRFHKQIKISKKCIPEKISATFIDGHLHIVIPKKITSVATTQDQPASALKGLDDGKSKPETKQDKAMEKLIVITELSTTAEGATSSRINTQSTKPNFEVESSVSRLKMNRRVDVKDALTVAVAVTLLGAYLTWNYMSSHVEN